MAPTRRSGRYDANTSTSYVVRTNLRRLREMRRLTQDQAVSRLEPPHLSSSSLGKIENGDRSVSIEEAVQLSVAYQVPLQVIVCPWTPHDVEHSSALSGADRMASVSNVQRWLLHFEYPLYPDMIARVGSALEGAANAIVFRDPNNLNTLAADPTPETLQSLLNNAIENILSPLKTAIDALIDDLTEWLGFDAFQLFDGFEENPVDYWPPELDRRLQQVQPPNVTENMEQLWNAHRNILNRADQLKDGYLTDLAYATPNMPDSLNNWLQEQLSRLNNWRPIYSALRANLL